MLGVALIGGPIVFMLSRFTAAYQASNNMHPTIVQGDRIILRNDPSQVRRGDIVTYDPDEWGLQGPRLGRVVAVGGDRISYAMGNEALTLNGEPLDEPYVNGAPGDGAVAFDVTVPENRVFILGDNRGNSADSRFQQSSGNGTLPVSAVTGVQEDRESPTAVGLGLTVFAGMCFVPLGMGLGIAALVVRRRKPVPAGPVWGAVHLDQP
ncbi:signal peptidase I [Streptomyces sp. NPDC091268]|uniref:signal peptidase I n=1 Tax=Streptomyces sp. NPDC091268 TaxID=3365979 RepID=UPI0037F38235